MLNSPKRKVEHTYHFSAWNVKTNSILNIQKIAIKASQVIFSKYGLSLDVLTEIFERWGRIINLTLTNYFITYWTFKKCVIKTSQVVSSKYGLSLDVLTEILESWSRITNLIVHRQKLFLRERNHIFTKFVTIPFINKTALKNMC